jgi:hypothetical protein
MDLAREFSFAGTGADEGGTISCDLPLGEAIRDALLGTDVFEALGCFLYLTGFYNSAVATHLSKESSSILLQSAHVYGRRHENSTN